MSNKIVVLKNTKKGLVVDTIYNSNDSLFIQHYTTTTIELPEGPIEVNTHPPEKDALDIIGIIAAIIGGLAAIIGAFIAFYQLFKKDEDKQKQLVELKEQTEQLIQQNQLFEKRIRMNVRPLIWSNGYGIKRLENKLTIKVNNRGQMAFVDEIVHLEGEEISLTGWSKVLPIEKEEGVITLRGNYGSLDPDTMYLRFLIKYHDTENFQYETEFEWADGKAKIVETRDL